MSKRELAVHLMHDENALALATLAKLAQSGTDTASWLQDTQAVSAQAAIVIVHASGERWKEMSAVQQRCHEAGQSVLFVTVEPGAVLIGPLVRPDGKGCLLCMKSWLANNHREGHRWYNDDVGGPSLRRDIAGPLSPTALQAYCDILASILTGLREEGDHWLEQATQRVDLDSLVSERHRFLPWTDCPACPSVPVDSPELASVVLTPRPKSAAQDDRQHNPLLNAASLRGQFVDRRTGLIPHVFHDMSSRLMPMFAAEMPIANSDTTEVGYGRSETRQGSELVAMLETLERYAGHAPRGKRTVVRASYAELGEQAVDPRKFILHEPGQASESGFALNRYDDRLEVDWVWGYSFGQQRPILVPQQLVYYWLQERHDQPINRFVFDTSSGCALGGSLEEAMLYGLMEVVERDAYLTTWYTQHTPIEIVLDSIANEQIQALCARARSEGFELHVFDIRQDIDIPVFWAMIVDPRPDAPVKSYCAAGAHLRPERAIYSALVEVTTSMGVYQRSLPPLRDKALEMLKDGSEVQQMSDHVLLYSLPQTYARLDFLHHGPRAGLDTLFPASARSQSLDLTEDLRAQLEKVLRVADDVIVVDQTFDAMQHNGLRCVKMLVPGLLPMTFGHQYRRVSLDRLQKAVRAKQAASDFTRADVNPHPHNFP